MTPLFWLAVALCAIAQVCIVAGAARTSREPAEGSPVPRPARWSEVGWTIVPALGLAAVLWFTHQAIEAHEAPAGAVAPAVAEVTR